MSCNSINLFFKNDMKINDLDDLPWNTFLSLSGKKKYTHLCLGVLKYLKPVLILTIILAYSNISGAPKSHMVQGYAVGEHRHSSVDRQHFITAESSFG